MILLFYVRIKSLMILDLSKPCYTAFVETSFLEVIAFDILFHRAVARVLVFFENFAAVHALISRDVF